MGKKTVEELAQAYDSSKQAFKKTIGGSPVAEQRAAHKAMRRAARKLRSLRNAIRRREERQKEEGNDS